MTTTRNDTSLPPARRSPPGWGSLLLATVARTYLTILSTLAGIALLPGLLGWHGTVVQTGSMQPHIAPGDVVVLSKLAEQDPVPIDKVVQFHPKGAAGQARTLILHRVTAANDDGTYTTAGDANPDPDLEPLHREQITGVGRLLVPYIGLPSLWWNTGTHLPMGLWVTGTLLALIAVARGRLQDNGNGDAAETSEHRVNPAPPNAGASAVEDHSASELVNAGGMTTGPVSAPVTGRVVARRAVFGMTGAAVLTGLAAHPVTRSSAALTASTSTGTSFATAASFPPSLGRAGAFALLAPAKIEDKIQSGKVGSSISGLIGTSAGTIVNYPTTDQNSPRAIDAMTDARALYQELKAKPVTTTVTTSPLAGTITSGVYSYPNSDLALGNLTLDAKGDPNAVFIIRGRSLTTQSGITIGLANGAKPGNVYWCADNNVRILSNNKIVGTWMAGGSIALETSVTLTGRALAVGTSSTTGTINTTADTITIPT